MAGLQEMTQLRELPWLGRFQAYRKFDGMDFSEKPYLLRYWQTFRKSKLRKLPSPEQDVAFVIHPDSRGWILDSLCRRLGSELRGRVAYHEGFRALPVSRAYFYSHYSFFAACLKRNPHLWNATNIVWFTHPRELDISEDELRFTLKQARRVICHNSADRRTLRLAGVPRRRIAVGLGAADPERFRPHRRGGGRVGLCSAYYPRKNGDLILAVVRQLQGVQFSLLGKNWQEYPRFSELCSLPNFHYEERPYDDYPDFFSKVDVFFSPSLLEGGPFSLVEAMMSNVVPVASRTGFAPDLITHGENGYLFDLDEHPDCVADLIFRALRNSTAQPHDSVKHLTWRNLARRIFGWRAVRSDRNAARAQHLLTLSRHPA